jgi:hypothetical protein
LPELNPVTRTRLWYINVFLMMDMVGAIYAGASLPPTSGYAFPAMIFGFLAGAGVLGLSLFLILTDKKEVNLKAQRSRE